MKKTTITILFAASAVALAPVVSAAPSPSICSNHTEYTDSPFGLGSGTTYIAACAVGSGGGGFAAPAAEEPTPEESSESTTP